MAQVEGHWTCTELEASLDQLGLLPKLWQVPQVVRCFADEQTKKNIYNLPTAFFMFLALSIHGDGGGRCYDVALIPIKYY